MHTTTPAQNAKLSAVYAAIAAAPEGGRGLAVQHVQEAIGAFGMPHWEVDTLVTRGMVVAVPAALGAMPQTTYLTVRAARRAGLA